MSPVNLGSAHGKIEIDTSGINRAVSSAQSAMSGFQSKMRSIGQGMTRAGKKMTMGVTLPLVGIGTAAAKTASDFESQMRIMEVAARDSGAGIEDLRKFALKMGADTFFSASEAADAMTGLFKAGMDATEVMGDMTGETGALAAAMDLAAASDLEMARAANAVSVAMATFGLSADDATMITNSFVQAADASVAEVGGLTEALVNIGPTAAQFGWSLGDVNTALAILSERGIRGSEAGTALKSMMTNLMRPTDDVKETLQDLNVSLYDAGGRMKALPVIIEELSNALQIGSESGAVMGQNLGALDAYIKAVREDGDYLNDWLTHLPDVMQEPISSLRDMGLSSEEAATRALELANNFKAQAEAGELALPSLQGLSEEQRNLAIQTLAGTYGMKAMSTLLEEGAAGWDGMSGAIGEAASAQEVANTRMDTFAGAMEALQGSIETFLIEVGTPLINDYLRPFVEWLTKTINKLQDLDPRVVKWGIAIAGVAAALGPLLIVLGQVAMAISALMPVITALGGALTVLTGPIGLVVAAVGGLALAWANNWGGIREKTASVIDKIKFYIEALDTKMYWLANFGIPQFMDDVKDGFGELKQTARDAIDGFLAGLREKWEEVKTWVYDHFGWIPEMVRMILGAESPSRVFAAIGSDMMVGLNQGIVERTPQVLDTLEQLGANMVAVAQGIGKEALGMLQATGAIPGGDGEMAAGGGGAPTIGAGSGGTTGFAPAGSAYGISVAPGMQLSYAEQVTNQMVGTMQQIAEKLRSGDVQYADILREGLQDTMQVYADELGMALPELGSSLAEEWETRGLAGIYGQDWDIGLGDVLPQGATARPRATTGGGTQRIKDCREIVINLDGREVARVTSPYLADELQQKGIRMLA